MPVFVCDSCGNIEELDLVLAKPQVDPGARMLCSKCLPVGVAQGGFKAGDGKWHGHFEERKYDPDQDLPINRSTGLGMESI